MPAVTRVTDPDVAHCSTPFRAQGSPNVYVNNLKLSREGDNNTTHLLPGSPCPSHAAAISQGSSTVKINSKGAGRVGDAVVGCTNVAGGSPNVFSG